LKQLIRTWISLDSRVATRAWPGRYGFYGIPRHVEGRKPLFIGCLDGLVAPRAGNADPHDFYEIVIVSSCAALCSAQNTIDVALLAVTKPQSCVASCHSSPGS